MPAALGPAGLCINGGVRDHAGLAVLLVPHATARAQHRAVDGRCPRAVLPGRQQRDEVAAHAANLRRQRVGERRQAPFPGAPAGPASLLREQPAQRLHLRRRLVQHGEQLMHRTQVAHDHDHQRLEKQALRIDRRMATPALSRGWRGRQCINQPHHHDKHTLLSYHEITSAATELARYLSQ